MYVDIVSAIFSTCDLAKAHTKTAFLFLKVSSENKYLDLNFGKLKHKWSANN